MKIGSKSWDSLIIEGANEFGIHLDHEKVKSFSLYAQELIRWNSKINLTSITDPFEIAVKHFIDSIIPSLYIPPDASIIDIGSGGGFPGLPLSILLPSISSTLIDTSRKKVSFLKHIARMLKIRNISIYQTRAEDISKKEQFAGSFDVIISRALFPLKKLMSIALPLVSKNGEIIAMKGKEANEDNELQSVHEQLSSWKNENLERNYTFSIKRYRLREIDAERSIFLFKF
ncbi:MAG: 16S rRNA (guanine(527)-N(7))-methyltransferase RsmG [Deltaproteobacteria bacterium]|nr:16S rRNA (guanine(527)-N(7))-methyltransferase RsmG [Deltaproteobacteria bacterium]MBW1847192.1 16S rRNA (guanine(527)-N(7))-methyltransferase RsmG [Deltaproteobacteria bacterium]MBW2364438.1 16S rRNA (guanine(527)-N(7))-methyltransferase RsmG [Deltaproteobacteria bacterium]